MKLLKLNLKLPCFGCGKKVPFWGETCPFCGDDKYMCQSVRVFSVGCFVGGLVIGAVFAGMSGFFIGGLFGLALFVAIEKLAVLLAPKSR